MYQWLEDNDLIVTNFDNEVLVNDLTHGNIKEILNNLQHIKPFDLPGIRNNVSKRIELRLLHRMCAELNYNVFVGAPQLKVNTTNVLLSKICDLYNGLGPNTAEVQASITVINVYKDINNSFETITSAVCDTDSNYITHYKQHRLPRVELQLLQNRFHKLSISVMHNGRICVVTNQDLTYATYRKLIAVLPALVPPVCEHSAKLIEIFKTFIEPTPEKFLQLCNEHYDFKTIQEKIQEELNNTILTEILQTLARSVTSNLNSVTRNIKNSLDDLTSYEEQRITLQKQLTDLDDTMGKCLRDLTDYVKTNKSIVRYKFSAEYRPMLELYTKTAVVNYNPDEAAQVILANKSTPLCPAKATPEYKNLLIKTFIENKYTILFCTKFTIYLGKLQEGLRCVSTSNYGVQHTGNPHLVDFNCYGGAAANITKALVNADLITAIANILAANANLNFFDTVVMEYVYDYLTKGDVVMLDEEGTETTSSELLVKERMLIYEANKTATGNN